MDAVSNDTASERRASGGDTYRLNILERPFSEDMATYRPELDLFTFSILEADDWFYFLIDMVGPIEPDESDTNYGIEIDSDRDGFGEFLIWVEGPFAGDWSAQPVQVLADENHDTAGRAAVRSDAPFDGDGYEAALSNADDDNGGSILHLALARIDPAQPTALQIAVKKSLIGESFMWSAWADAGLRDPGMFGYNDRFSEREAGSPLANSDYYPLKAVHLVDSTCRAPYGFSPNGGEAMLCPSSRPQVTFEPTRPRPSRLPPPESTPTVVPSPIPPRSPTATEPPFPVTPTAPPPTPIPPSPPTPTQPPGPTDIPPSPVPPDTPTSTEPPGPTGVP